jgi:hypothetical protein
MSIETKIKQDTAAVVTEVKVVEQDVKSDAAAIVTHVKTIEAKSSRTSTPSRPKSRQS